MRLSDRHGADAEVGKVLVVDDESDIRELLELSIVRMGLDVESAGSVKEAIELLQTKSFDLCLTDMRLSDGDGIEIVKFISAHCQDLPVAIITAFGSTENAVNALKAGAFDYLTKPLSLEQLRTLIKSALSVPARPAAKAAASELLGGSLPMEQVRSTIVKLARSQAPVYIRGESGSGKELAARSIHDSGPRRSAPFVAVNCGAIPENLMESEFFGYRKGAFTGAESDRDGFFHAASGGTLFLDEVAELPVGMQVKLLRAIQEKAVRRVGSATEEPVDVRIICATHQDLQGLVGKSKFRQDLYYRLAVIELKMPALRERREDIRPLGEAILRRLSGGSDGRSFPTLTATSWRALESYDFPGNVRELENILERALALSGGQDIAVEDLQLMPPRLSDDSGIGDGAGESEREFNSLPDFLDGIERKAILEALEKTRFNRTAAAKRLGITFRALRYRMARLGIQ